MYIIYRKKILKRHILTVYILKNYIKLMITLEIITQYCGNHGKSPRKITPAEVILQGRITVFLNFYL